MGIFMKGINNGAYRGKLTCPVCSSEAIRYVENVSQFRLRYRCRKCGMTFQYDISNSPVGVSHPYAAFNKNKYRRIVERWEAGEKQQRRSK